MTDTNGYRAELRFRWVCTRQTWADVDPKAQEAFRRRAESIARQNNRTLARGIEPTVYRDDDALVIIWETVLDFDMATDEQLKAAGITWEDPS